MAFCRWRQRSTRFKVGSAGDPIVHEVPHRPRPTRRPTCGRIRFPFFYFWSDKLNVDKRGSLCYVLHINLLYCLCQVCCSTDTETLCNPKRLNSTDEQQWTDAPVIQQETSVLTLDVPCDVEQHVTGIRYIWRESPCPLEACAVYSVENSIPGPPFRYNGHIAPSKNMPLFWLGVRWNGTLGLSLNNPCLWYV